MSKRSNISVGGIVSVLLILVVIVFTTSWNGQPNLYEISLEKLQDTYGLTWEKVHNSPQLNELLDMGVPIESINAFVGGSGLDGGEELYPIRIRIDPEGYLAIKVGHNNARECGAQSIEYGANDLPVTLSMEYRDEGCSMYARVYFEEVSEDLYHQSFTIDYIKVSGKDKVLQQQVNPQPFSVTRKNITFFVISQEEWELLRELKECGSFTCCGGFGCPDPSDLSD